LLTIAAITVTAFVASRRRVPAVVDVGDRRADGNGYEDEEPHDAAYRPRLRHPRNDGGRTKRFITVAGRFIVIFGPGEIATRPDDSIARRRPPRHDRRPRTFRSAYTLHGALIVSTARSLRNRRQEHLGTPSDGHHRGVSRIIIVGTPRRLSRSLLRLLEARRR